MKIRSTAFIVLMTFVVTMAVPYRAEAMVINPAVKAFSIVEDIACRTVKQRIVIPGGGVKYRAARLCGAAPLGPAPVCQTVRRRIVQEDGSIVSRNVRRCY
jgi:hypothetical protein